MRWPSRVTDRRASHNQHAPAAGRRDRDLRHRCSVAPATPTPMGSQHDGDMTLLRFSTSFTVFSPLRPVMAAPDVDKTPFPGGPVPIPYPNTGADSEKR